MWEIWSEIQSTIHWLYLYPIRHFVNGPRCLGCLFSPNIKVVFREKVAANFSTQLQTNSGNTNESIITEQLWARNSQGNIFQTYANESRPQLVIVLGYGLRNRSTILNSASIIWAFRIAYFSSNGLCLGSRWFCTKLSSFLYLGPFVSRLRGSLTSCTRVLDFL